MFGSLADRLPRTKLIAGGVALWSLATAAAAFAFDFWSFLIARAFVGVGEAAYATLAPPLLSDFYSAEKRNRVLTVFYVAIPVGAAIGFTLGGYLGANWGWRAAFLICGHGSDRASTTLNASHIHDASAETSARYVAHIRAAPGVPASRMPRVPAWKAAIERKAAEKIRVVSQWPRRSVASTPITAASQALAITSVIWIGELEKSTRPP